jgi:putative peptidoglycan lipid II flippase
MIYMRGNFNLDSVKLTASVLMFYLIGVLGFGFRDFMNRTFHSLQDTKTPFKVACLVVVLNIILNIILRKLMGARGLALATSISSFCGLFAMFVLLRRRMGRLGLKNIAPEFIKLLVSALACAAACMAVGRALPAANGTLGAFARLVAGTAAGMIVYLAACLLLRVQALKSMVGEFTGRIRK